MPLLQIQVLVVKVWTEKLKEISKNQVLPSYPFTGGGSKDLVVSELYIDIFLFYDFNNYYYLNSMHTCTHC